MTHPVSHSAGSWEPFQPSDQTPWDLRAAAHLFRRAGFGANWEQLNSAVAKHPADVVSELLNAEQPDDFRRDIQSLADAAIATGNARQLSGWWTWRMLSTPAQLLEKTTLFWHGHFATSAAKVDPPRLMLAQNELLRRYALGNFGELLLEISRDPAMLIWLDSASNRKQHPNENYAREIMELFCLGEGNYSEQDIRELARCFTGWEVRRDAFRFNRYQHDTGTKTILGQTGEFNGEDGVRIVLSQPTAAEFIAGKLVRFFVSDTLELTNELITPLAVALRTANMEVKPVIAMILNSQLFYSSQSVARKIRSPAELAIGFLRCLDGTTNTLSLAETMDQIGQGLFYPPSVKGWDGGRTWINSSTLLGRSNAIRRVLESDKTRFGRESLQQYFAQQQLSHPQAILERLEVLLLAVPVSADARTRIESVISTAGNSTVGLVEGLHAICTLPEFQLC
ncbi:MAG: DUF1800 domain-containing protein [Planctomycetaceae bacterium]|nr:DUF1800 domain-containing protein [Planctomycetaceae bacterium]